MKFLDWLWRRSVLFFLAMVAAVTLFTAVGC